MGDPKGFLTLPRTKVLTRPVEERRGDYLQVYTSLPQIVVQGQASRCMDCGVPFCNTGCPVDNLIPEWNDLVYQGQWREAIDRLHLTNNFPEFTGLLCPAPCEDACVLSINDSPVTIKEVERSIIEKAFAQGWVVPQPPEQRTGKRIAVVGSGPAGLAAAQQLNRCGHHVTVFEKDEVIGGLLVHGIPDFKIEKWMVQRRVDLLTAEGIEFRPNVHVGNDPTLDELRDTHHAVLLAVGALAGRDLDVPGRELNGIYLAMDYLVQQNRRVAGRPVAQRAITAAGKRVVIIGGGDTGADCLGNAHREGATSVHILTHGPQPPATPDPLSWPHVPFALRTWPAHEEGGERKFLVEIQGFSGTDGNGGNGNNGNVQHVRLRHIGQDSVDTGGEWKLSADLVLLAVGFTGPVHDELLTQLQPEMTSRGAIACNDNFETNAPGVFVTGDAMRGASLIVWAIADGRNAARSIDQYVTSSVSNSV